MPRKIVDWKTENVYRDIIFELPGIMERNEWLRYMYQNFQEAEDPSVASPWRSAIPYRENSHVSNRKKSQEFTKLSLVEMMDESCLRRFWLTKRVKEEYE
ncbi:hypothetical protein [Ferroplasma acidarmanus]|nr:hypothetical protein [Ferroplasma acidarmanus]